MHYLQSRLKGLSVPIAISVLLVGVFIFKLLSFAGVNDEARGASSCPPPDPKSMVQDEYGLYPFDQVVVVLEEGQAASRAAQIARQFRGRVQCAVTDRTYLLTVPSKNSTQLQRLIQKLEDQHGVKSVFRNYRTLATPL